VVPGYICTAHFAHYRWIDSVPLRLCWIYYYTVVEKSYIHILYSIVSIDDCNRERSYINKHPFVFELYITYRAYIMYNILRVVYLYILRYKAESGREDKNNGRAIEVEWESGKKNVSYYYYTRGSRYIATGGGGRACAVGRYPFTVGRFMMDSVCWSTGQLHSRRARVAARGVQSGGEVWYAGVRAVLSSPILKIGEAMFTRKGV